MDFNFEIGDQLLLHLITGDKLEGEFRGGTRGKINLINVKKSGSNTDVTGGFIVFHKSDLASVTVISQNQKNDKGKQPDNLKISPINNRVVHTVLMDEDEYERLDKMCTNNMCISEANSNCAEVIEYCLNCENVSCVALGKKLVENETIDLLVLCTWKQVYIFDLKADNKLIDCLKPVFESYYVTKVMHHSQSLVQCLRSHYKINVANIFDTGVADKYASKENTRGIMDCLVHYFNFPQRLFPRELSPESSTFVARPLSKERRVEAARLSAYLITLKNHVLEKYLLKNFYKTMDKFAHLYVNKSSFTTLGLKSGVLNSDEIIELFD